MRLAGAGGNVDEHLNEIIDDANDKDDNLIILFQDLSKAYDRVNLYMLDRAMIRLKIPYNFRKFIMNIFTNRKNRVFTAVDKLIIMKF